MVPQGSAISRTLRAKSGLCQRYVSPLDVAFWGLILPFVVILWLPAADVITLLGMLSHARRPQLFRRIGKLCTIHTLPTRFLAYGGNLLTAALEPEHLPIHAADHGVVLVLPNWSLITTLLCYHLEHLFLLSRLWLSSIL